MRVFLASVSTVVVIAAGCSSSGSDTTATTTSLKLPAATLNPNRIPAPHSLQQTIGLGPNWQMTVNKATFSATAVVVTLALRNGSPQSVTIPPDLRSMFSARDWIGGNDIAPVDLTVKPSTVASGAAANVTITFKDVAIDAKDPTLVFRGRKLNGSLDATVALKYAPKPTD